MKKKTLFWIVGILVLVLIVVLIFIFSNPPVPSERVIDLSNLPDFDGGSVIPRG